MSRVHPKFQTLCQRASAKFVALRVRPIAKRVRPFCRSIFRKAKGGWGIGTAHHFSSHAPSRLSTPSDFWTFLFRLFIAPSGLLGREFLQLQRRRFLRLDAHVLGPKELRDRYFRPSHFQSPRPTMYTVPPPGAGLGNPLSRRQIHAPSHRHECRPCRRLGRDHQRQSERKRLVLFPQLRRVGRQI
jgi:hypothetical protein